MKQRAPLKLSYTYWQDGDFLVGHFDDHPGHDTQGRTLEELEFMLNDLYYEMELYNEPVAVRRGALELLKAAG